MDSTRAAKPSPEIIELTIRAVHLESARKFSVQVQVRGGGTSQHSRSGQAVLDLTKLPHPATDPGIYGKNLADMLFHDPAVLQCWAILCHPYLTSAQRRVRVLLIVESDEQALHNVSWETLKLPYELDNTERATVSLHEAFSFARCPAQRTAFKHDSLKAPPRVLAVIASPADSRDYDLTPFDVESQVDSLHKALAWADIKVLASGTANPPTRQDLNEKLRRQYDIVCFICHGRIRHDDGKPILYLENEDGATDPITCNDLQRMLAEVSPPRLIILCACDTATANVHGSLGHALTAQGVPAVIAMNGMISTDTIQQYLTTFGQQVAQRDDIYEAAREARVQLREQESWWQPVLYARTDVSFKPAQQPAVASTAPTALTFTLVDLRRRHAAELHKLLQQGGVPETRLARTLCQVFHHYGILMPAPGRDGSFSTIQHLAAYVDESIIASTMGSPLLTFAAWVGDRLLTTENLDLHHKLVGWREAFCAEVGWTPAVIFTPKSPNTDANACLYLTIHLSAHDSGDLNQRTFTGRLVAEAWLWCSDIPRKQVPIDIDAANTTYELSGKSLAKLYGNLFQRVRHIIEVYQNRMVVEWMVPWRLLDWPFGQQIHVRGSMGDQAIGQLYPLVVRLDHAFFGQTVVPWIKHQERFVDRPYAPICGDEVQVRATIGDEAQVSDSAGSGDKEQPPLVLIVPSAPRLVSSRQPRTALKDLQALLEAKAAILLWPQPCRSNHRLESGLMIDELERLVINQLPACPPVALVKRADLVVVWDDLGRLPLAQEPVSYTQHPE